MSFFVGAPSVFVYLESMAAKQHWTKTDAGYQLGGHTLAKRGRRWWLTTDAGAEHDLGTRASFDHAEAIIGAK